MKLMRYFPWLLLLLSLQAHGVLRIEITQGVESALPIAVVPFGWNIPNVQVIEQIDEVVSADLHRSGYFSPVDKKNFLSWPTQGNQVRCKDWRMLGAENVVVGDVRPVGEIFEVTYELWDILRCNAVQPGKRFRVKGADMRKLAHQISDEVFEALTGIRGAFNTRIAYIAARKNTRGETIYQLQVADSDGANPQTILESKQSILSLSWSPDGGKLAYASFDAGPVTVYVQDLQTGQRQRLFQNDDQVSGPAWSPDGTKLALVISRNGRRDIYIYSTRSRLLSQVTHTLPGSFATEPVWTPDGNNIIYTAHLDGRPQIYIADIDGGRPKRLTFEGTYNTRPTISPDGKLLGMVHGEGNEYHIAILEMETGSFRVLTKTTLDESPSFAPNGSMVLFATRDRNRGVLAAVSADGRVQQRFQLEEGGDAREPAWGPYISP